MSSSSYLAIAGIGFLLLVYGLFFDTDSDVDLDVDVDADFDSDSGGGAGILDWVSVKALSSLAVGFGLAGWAFNSMDWSTTAALLAAVTIGILFWIFVVLLLLPWVKAQQGDDLQSTETYIGIAGEVVVTIGADQIGTIQFKDRKGLVVRKDARAAKRGDIVPIGKSVLIIDVSPSGTVVVEEYGN